MWWNSVGLGMICHLESLNVVELCRIGHDLSFRESKCGGTL